MQLSITAPNLPQLIELWRRAPQLTLSALQAATDEAALLLQREVNDRTPVGVGGGGGLRGSLSNETTRLSDGVVGLVGATAMHAEPVELGTQPHFPPPHALEDWVKAKFDPPDEEISGIAYAIARKISRVGTKGAFMFRDALKAAEPAVRRIFDEAANDLAQRMVQA